MKKTIKSIINFCFCVCTLVAFCSCAFFNWVDSYKKFNVENISDNLNEDYFSSKCFEFSTVNGVVIIPSMKEFSGEYCIYVSLYSQTGEEKVELQTISVIDGDILLKYEIRKNAVFEARDNNIYKWSFEGWREENSVWFTDTELELFDGKTFYLEVGVEVARNNEIINKKIQYKVTVTQIRGPVLPT